MTDIANQVRSLIETFTADIAALVRQDTVRQISDALGSVGKITVAATKRGPGRPRGSARAKGSKRASGDIASTSVSILAFITENPGQGVEAIAKGLGTSSRDLKLPIKKLLADGLVKTKGQRRGTKYFAK